MIGNTERHTVVRTVAEVSHKTPESDLVHALVTQDLAQFVVRGSFTLQETTSADGSWLKTQLFGHQTYVRGITENEGYQLPTTMVCRQPNILRRALATYRGKEPTAYVDVEIVAIEEI